MKNLNKYFLISIISLIIINCDNEKTNDCIQTPGNTIQKEFTLDFFDEVIVNDDIELFVIDSDENKIIIEAGENLINDININITSNILEITNYNSCFFYKDFGSIKAYVYNSNIKKIRNSSSLTVQSIGVLNYPSLELWSENYLSDYLNSGNFNLEVNNNYLGIIDNGYSTYFISGKSNFLNIQFASHSPRFEGENLIVNDAIINTTSSNDILIKVTNQVSGKLFSTGDVILFKEPLINNLETFYNGEVILNY